MTGNPGYPLESEHAPRRNARPAIQGRVLNPQLTSQRDNATGLFGPFSDNINHVADRSLRLRFLSREFVAAKW